MKIFYYNDTEDLQMVHKNDCSGDNLALTEPLKGQLFDVPLKEGDSIMVKQWKGRILITKVDKSAIEDIEKRASYFKTGIKTYK